MRLDVEFTAKQGLAWDKLNDDHTKFTLFGGAAGGGKSWLLAAWLVMMCCNPNMPGTRWFIGREELKRLRESTLETLFKFCSTVGVSKSQYKYNGQDHFIRWRNGSRIDLLDLKYLPSDPLYERYGSIEYTGGAMDEGGEIHFGAFDVLKTRIGRCHNEEYGLLPAKMLIGSNPKKNWLYKYFYLPNKNGTLPKEYAFIPALATENRFLDKGYIDNLDGITDKVTKERLKYGNWEYDDNANSLIHYDNILNLFTNLFVQPGLKCITADIARFGKDKTIIGRWSGLRLEEIERIDKSSIPDAAKVIRAIATVHGIPMSNVVVDEDGVGGGVKDILNCRGFVNNARPIEVKGKDCNYANLKSQCSFLLSEDVNNSLVYVNCKHEAVKNMIIEELEQVKDASVDTDGKKAVVSKDKVKDAIGRSPDYADMMIMRKYIDLPHVSKITGWR